MTSLASLVNPTLVERLGWTLVHSLWQGVLIAAVSGILFFALRGARPQTRYLAACASLLLMIASAAITFSMIAPSASPLSPSPSPAPSASASASASASTAAGSRGSIAESAAIAAETALLSSPSAAARARNDLGSVSGTLASRTRMTSSTSDEPAPAPGPAITAAATPVTATAAPASPTRPLPLALLDAYRRTTIAIEQMLPLLVTLWIAGLCFCAVRLLGGLAVVARVKRYQTSPASNEWQQRLAALARRMHVRGRDAISLHVSANIRTAAVIGWLRPVILVPASALTGLAPQQMEAVLAHELAHIRRHDYLVNLLQSVVETLFFYHPAVWYLSARVRTEREHCCDDDAVAVVGDPVTYAGALTDLEMLRQGAPALAMAANGGSLLRRIERLLSPRSEAAPSWSTATGLLTLGVVFAVLATAHGSIAAGLQPESTGAISKASASDSGDDQWPTPPPPPPAPARRASEFPHAMPPPPPAPPEPPVAEIDSDIEPPSVPPVPPTPPVAVESAVFAPMPPVPPAPGTPRFAPVPRAVPTPPLPPPAFADGERYGLARWGVPPPVPPAAPEAPVAPAPSPAHEIMAVPPVPRAPGVAPVPAAPHAFADVPAPPAPPAPVRTAGPTPAPAAPPAPPAPRAFGAVPAIPAPPAPPAAPAPDALQAQPAKPSTPSKPPAPSEPSTPRPPAPPKPPAEEGGIGRAMNWIGSWFDFPEGNRISYSDGNRRFSIRHEGDVEFTEDDTDVRSLSEGGYLVIDEKIGWDRTRVEIRHGSDGRLQRTFYRNGKVAAYEPEGRAWLSKKIPDLIRNSGFGADARVRRIHTAGGPAAVLAEVTLINSSYVKRLYLTRLLELRTVQGPMLTKLIAQAGQEIESDYELTELLREIVKERLMTADDQRLAYTAATRSLNSSYEHRRALQPLLESGPLAEPVLRAAIDGGSTIDSDYELTELLLTLGKTQTLAPTVMDAYVATAASIASDYELGRALKQAANSNAALPPAVVRDILRASLGIDSDYEMAEFLITLVTKQKVDDTARAALFTAADTVHSDFEHGRVLKAIVGRPGLNDAIVLGVIESTRGMNSAFEAANVLRDVAANYTPTGDVRKAFVSAAERLSSDHERDRVLVALVKTEARQ
jgi:beta-lactamase regulating signal transducer with metallopeptidase domain